MVMRQGELTSCINLFCMHAFDTLPSYKKMKKWGEKKRVIPPGIEPGTLSVLDSRDNRYTTESPCKALAHILLLYTQIT